LSYEKCSDECHILSMLSTVTGKRRISINFLLRFSICSCKVIKVLTFLDVASGKKKRLLVLAEVQRRGGERS